MKRPHRMPKVHLRGSLMHCYFNLVSPQESIIDEEGIAVADADEARTFAREAVTEMVQDGVAEIAHWRGWKIEGRDASGLGVHAEMELPPRPAPLGAVLPDQPIARAVELQPRAVDQQVHGAGIAASAALRTVAARLRPRHLQGLGRAAQGGVVRHGEVEPE